MLGAAAAAGMMIMGQGVASANVAWCIADPPVQVVTPDGHNLMVNTAVYLPPASQHLKSSVAESASAQPDGSGGTLITVRVVVPAGISGASVVSSENRYQMVARGYGAGGTTVTLYLDVPAA